MNNCGSGHSMGTCEPSLTLSIASGSQTDALVSDYSSKDKPSTGQKALWLAPPIEWPARRIFAPSIAQSRGNSEHLYMLLRELANTGICLPEIGFGTWNLQWRCRTASGRNRTRCFPNRHGGGIGNRRNRRQGNPGSTRSSVSCAKVLPRNFRKRDLVAAAERSLRRLGKDHIDLYRPHWPNLTIPIEEPMSVLDGLTLCAKGRCSM